MGGGPRSAARAARTIVACWARLQGPAAVQKPDAECVPFPQMRQGAVATERVCTEHMSLMHCLPQMEPSRFKYVQFANLGDIERPVRVGIAAAVITTPAPLQMMRCAGIVGYPNAPVNWRDAV